MNAEAAAGGAGAGGAAGGGGSGGGASGDGADKRGFGHVLVERSGGIGGFLVVWDLNIDATAQPEKLGERVADLPWPHREDGEDGSADAPGAQAAPGPSSADRYVYLIESRFGYARFGEKELTGEWKDLVDHVRDVAEPERRPPGGR
ncbi:MULTISPECIES: hypothetical protein [unclassified Brevibacterium]|uniref:hypothetical protein n=1 Tax=unclassified Brevibacterium TaxID=2614124 RepID=UPI0010F7EF7A|nr:MULTISPECIES: hypothetical protein [unclassified Brevibacterium]MCM1011460.1 hypothetical protein [Brevibacterium sp. XM4083]